MTHAVARIRTLALAAVCAAAAAGAQAISNQSAAAATTTTPTNVARVYVLSAKGVNVYTASSTGKLALVSGSPFKNTAGLMIGAISRPLWSNSYE